MLISWNFPTNLLYRCGKGHKKWVSSAGNLTRNCLNVSTDFLSMRWNGKKVSKSYHLRPFLKLLFRAFWRIFMGLFCWVHLQNHATPSSQTFPAWNTRGGQMGFSFDVDRWMERVKIASRFLHKRLIYDSVDRKMEQCELITHFCITSPLYLLGVTTELRSTHSHLLVSQESEHMPSRLYLSPNCRRSCTSFAISLRNRTQVSLLRKLLIGANWGRWAAQTNLLMAGKLTSETVEQIRN